MVDEPVLRFDAVSFQFDVSGPWLQRVVGREGR